VSDDKRTFRHESLQDANALADHLAEIADAIRAGTLHLSDERGEMALEPRGLIRFELTGQQDADQCGVTLSLSWRADKRLAPSTLKISQGADASEGDDGP